MPGVWIFMSGLSLFSVGNGHRASGKTLVDIPLGLFSNYSQADGFSIPLYPDALWEFSVSEAQGNLPRPEASDIQNYTHLVMVVTGKSPVLSPTSQMPLTLLGQPFRVTKSSGTDVWDLLAGSDMGGVCDLTQQLPSGLLTDFLSLLTLSPCSLC